MKNYFEDYQFLIGNSEETPFMNKYDIFQDGTTPMYRDIKGKLWAMSGHSHMGHIGMFCGNSINDLKEAYPINTTFMVGKAGESFNGIKYPEGIYSRGSIWPFGLYICPVTNRFFCFFHNETGWNGKGTGYIINGKGDGEPDFRHIGLMHSDDEGKNWNFDRWVLTSEAVCFSELYDPDGINAVGQKKGETSLGCGDFSIYVEPEGEYIYLFYNLLTCESDTHKWMSCNVFVARTRKRTDGVMGDFVKYYGDSFSEAGNLGKESEIVSNAWHPRIIFMKNYNIYIMSASFAGIEVENNKLVAGIMELRTSTDMLLWSDPVRIPYKGKYFGNHYIALISESSKLQPHISDGSFSILSCHNGTDVMRYHVDLINNK